MWKFWTPIREKYPETDTDINNVGHKKGE